VSQRRYAHIFVPTGLLLLIAASRVLRLGTWELVDDEIWTIWQTFGSAREIIHWTPYDWPPLYYLFIGGWKALAGIHPTIVAYSSVLFFLFGAASMYRLGMKVFKSSLAASLAMLVYSAMTFGVIVSIMLRGYVVVLALLPFTLWLSLIYVERPNWRLGVALGVIFALQFYVTLSSSVAIIWVGLFTVVVYPRRIRYWWLPALITALLSIPEAIDKLDLITDRKDTANTVSISLFHRLEIIYHDFAGDLFAFWIVLFLAAGVLLLWEMRRSRRYEWGAALFIMIFGYSVVMYYAHPITGLFHSTRFAIWVLVGFGLWIGGGLAHLPRSTGWVFVPVLSLVLFAPIPVSRYAHEFLIPTPPLKAGFNWLDDRIRWGDAIVVDPNAAVSPEMWDYYLRVYFPQGGVYLSDRPGDFRRIWYAVYPNRQDRATWDAVLQGRQSGVVWYTDRLAFTLFEAPPDPEGVLFENGMRFHGFDILDDDGLVEYGYPLRHEGETFRLRLWWSVDRVPELDYSVGLFVLRPDGSVLIDSNSAPQVSDQPNETSRWVPGTTYIEERELEVPPTVLTAHYPVYLAVYHWTDQKRLSAPGVDDQGLLLLTHLAVKSWSVP
jgi:hypothetical protein